MKNITLLFILILVCFNNVFPQSVNHTFKINGSITQLEEGIIYISYNNGEQFVVDSSKIVNGNFEFSGTINQPVLANLRLVDSDILDSKALPLFMDPTSMNVKLSNNPFAIIDVQGSKTHQELSEWISLRNNARDQLARVLETRETEKDIAKLQLLEDSLIFFNDEKKRVEYDFFKSHPKSYVTAFVLGLTFRDYTSEELKGMYNNMGSILQMSSNGIYILEQINKKTSSEVGDMAKDFSAKDLITGNDFNLFAARGKYIFIDFWGSWCIPCIELIPSLVEEYAKYKDRNIIFLSIAFDTESDLYKTKAIIKEQGMNWVNLWQDQKMKDENKSIPTKFNVSSYPTTIIIDPTGKIIHRSVGNNEFIKISRLLAQIFKTGA